MTTKTPTKKHVKMYAKDKFIDELKAAAESKGLSQSSYIYLATRQAMALDELENELGLK